MGNNAFLYAAASFRFAEDLERVFFNSGAGNVGGGPLGGAGGGINLLNINMTRDVVVGRDLMLRSVEIEV